MGFPQHHLTVLITIWHIHIVAQHLWKRNYDMANILRQVLYRTAVTSPILLQQVLYYHNNTAVIGSAPTTLNYSSHQRSKLYAASQHHTTFDRKETDIAKFANIYMN